MPTIAPCKHPHLRGPRRFAGGQNTFRTGLFYCAPDWSDRNSDRVSWWRWRKVFYRGEPKPENEVPVSADHWRYFNGTMDEVIAHKDCNTSISGIPDRGVFEFQRIDRPPHAWMTAELDKVTMQLRPLFKRRVLLLESLGLKSDDLQRAAGRAGL